MTHTFTINELEAVALAADRGATRLHLQGVLFELHEGSVTSLIATDGHRLHSIRAQTDSQPIKSATLPNAAIKTLLTMAKANCDTLSKFDQRYFRLTVIIDGGALTFGMVHVDDNGHETPVINTSNQQFAANGGNFPDWRRVMPKASESTEHHAIAVSGVYMSDFGKAAKLLGDKLQFVRMESTGKGAPIRITLREPSFMGVLMPMRDLD